MTDDLGPPRVAGRAAAGPAPHARRLVPAALALLLTGPAGAQERPRLRDLGVVIGLDAPGPLNAITDVAGVRVGHVTLLRGDSVRTGVTVVVPHGGDVFTDRVPAAVVVGNGFGKLAGSTQVQELGELETPIALTCTLCTWAVAEGVARWMLARPGREGVRSINPVVAETNDGLLNAIRAFPVRPEDAMRALDSARAGPVPEGSVGAGTGTVAFGWKGGIGTSSRVVAGGGWTVGVLVQANFGGWRDLRIDGVPVGRALGRAGVGPPVWRDTDGSVVVVVATDAPLSDRNLRRLATRTLLGIGRVGGSMANGSGDYAIAFSTHPAVRRRGVAAGPPDTLRTAELGNAAAGALFAPAVDATEEAVLNALLRATTVRGALAVVKALPIDEVRAALRRP